MSGRVPTTRKRTATCAPLLGLAGIAAVAMTAGPAEGQQYSSQFLDVLNAACFSDPSSRHQSEQPGTLSRIRVILANARSIDLSQICAYDLTCGAVVFSGRIERSRRVSFTVCADSRSRGHILLLDRFGTLIERRDLQSPATIQLGR